MCIKALPRGLRRVDSAFRRTEHQCLPVNEILNRSKSSFLALNGQLKSAKETSVESTSKQYKWKRSWVRRKEGDNGCEDWEPEKWLGKMFKNVRRSDLVINSRGIYVF